jgi:hypothetical protein
MTIEISDKKYWTKLNYDDGMLYCQLLDIDGKNDWRMIEHMGEIDDLMDEINKGKIEDDDDIYFYNAWVVADGKNVKIGTLAMLHWIIPVRNV